MCAHVYLRVFMRVGGPGGTNKKTQTVGTYFILFFIFLCLPTLAKKAAHKHTPIQRHSGMHTHTHTHQAQEGWKS